MDTRTRRDLYPLTSEKLIIRDLDKLPDEIYGGRWINADYFLKWLEEWIDIYETANKVRETADRTGRLYILKLIRDELK